MTDTRTKVLILAAHGSMATDDANQPLFDLADRISRRGRFDCVTPAFLNGQPEMTSVFEELEQQNILPGDAVIVPVMTSEGYYLKKLPEKFAANANADDFRIMMTPVIGVHPSIQQRINRRIDILLDQFQLNPDETTIALIGHGTRRNPNSGAATFKLAKALEETMKPGLKIETGFLDQDPSIESIANKIQSQNVLIMPFLVSRGPHTTVDVPEAFGLPVQPGFTFPYACQKADQFFVYDFPLALYPGMEELCLETANEQLADGTPLVLPVLATSNLAQSISKSSSESGGNQ